MAGTIGVEILSQFQLMPMKSSSMEEGHGHAIDEK
jgi:hypothetical protein